MIEIIKAGTKNQIECNNCGALLGYTIKDVKEEEKFISQRDSYIQKYIPCQQCKNKIVLQATK